MDTATEAWSETEALKEKAKEAAQEGEKKINTYTEKAASKTPSLLFVAGALASIAVSLFLQIRGKKQWSLFVAHWVPSLMMFGLYNKMAKTIGAN
jgi:hypothetical protein